MEEIEVEFSRWLERFAAVIVASSLFSAYIFGSIHEEVEDSISRESDC